MPDFQVSDPIDSGVAVALVFILALILLAILW